MILKNIKPAVSKYWLMALAGVAWSCVGVMLCCWAYQWLTVIQWQWSMSIGSLGIILAGIAYRYGFSSIAQKNIDRLCQLSDRACIFAFQAWKSYFIVIIMVFLGTTIRRSPLPKHLIAIIYLTMGGALFLSSLHFYHRLWLVKVQKRPCEPLVDD